MKFLPQSVHCLTDLRKGDLFGNEGFTQTRAKDKPHLALREFFVLEQRGHDSFCGNILRQFQRQVETGERVENKLAFLGRKPRFEDRKLTRSDQPDTKGFAVQKASVPGGVFDAMPHSVAEVKQCAQPLGLVLVFADDGSLDLDVAPDDLRERRRFIRSREIICCG